MTTTVLERRGLPPPIPWADRRINRVSCSVPHRAPDSKRRLGCDLLEDGARLSRASISDGERKGPQRSPRALEDHGVGVVGGQELGVKVEIRPRHDERGRHPEGDPVMVIAPRGVRQFMKVHQRDQGRVLEGPVRFFG